MDPLREAGEGGRRTVEIQKELFSGRRSRVERYRKLVVGQPGAWPLLRYELINLLCSRVPGAAGLFLRSRLYPRLLGSCGRNVVFGTDVWLRHPHKIHIADNVVVDDHCLLDAKGEDNAGIFIGSGVFIGRNTILSCKNGDILIDDEANLGFNVEVFSGSRVRIGRKVLIAAYAYLVGGDHKHDRVDVPVLDQGRTAEGIEVADHAWIGAHVVVADGVRVGEEAIVGAGAVVLGDIPEWAIAAGVPARVIRDRRDRQEPG